MNKDWTVNHFNSLNCKKYREKPLYGGPLKRSWGRASHSPGAIFRIALFSSILGACGGVGSSQSELAVEETQAAALMSPPSYVVEAPDSSEAFGEFNGVSYVKYNGRFTGTAAGGAFSVPYEIVAPANTAHANGRVIVEPLHPFEGPGARRAFLTPEFLFNRRTVHASIGWDKALVDDLGPEFFIADAGDDLEIIANFGRAVRTDATAQGLLGHADNVYAIGFSFSSEPLQRMLLDPIADGAYQLTILLTPSGGAAWPGTVPPASAGKVIVLSTEADLLVFGAKSYRQPDREHPTYRFYEVAGAPHIPDVPGMRESFPGPVPPPVEGTTPLDWTLVLRALTIDGDLWVRWNIRPPKSIAIEDDSNAADGIARDADGNALGGIRMPDLAIGRGQFIASDPTPFPQGFFLFGDFVDLQCEPLANGSPRFSSHRDYVRKFARVATKLAFKRLILPGEALALVREARQSDVGDPSVCQ